MRDVKANFSQPILEVGIQVLLVFVPQNGRKMVECVVQDFALLVQVLQLLTSCKVSFLSQPLSHIRERCNRSQLHQLLNHKPVISGSSTFAMPIMSYSYIVGPATFVLCHFQLP